MCIIAHQRLSVWDLAAKCVLHTFEKDPVSSSHACARMPCQTATVEQCVSFEAQTDVVIMAASKLAS